MDSHVHVAASQALDKDQTAGVMQHFVFTRDVENLSTPSLIKRTWLNGDNSHPSVLFEPLIEDEEAHRMVTPNFAYKYACSSIM